MPNSYKLVLALRDSARVLMEDQASAATNRHRLFMEDPNVPLPEEEGSMDDPGEAGTRVIDGGFRKVCLLYARYPVPTTVLNESLATLARQDRNRAIILATVSVPAKSVKLLGSAIFKGVPGDKYTDTILMAVMGNSLVPEQGGKVIPGIIYTRSKGWEHV